VIPNSPGKVRIGYLDSPAIEQKADSPTNVLKDCILSSTALLRLANVFIIFSVVDAANRASDSPSVQ
jgi:hypothetical protein